jgi:hypothetical protein
MTDDLEAAEHAGCMIFNEEVPPWAIAGLSWGFPPDPQPRMCLEVASGLRFRGVGIRLEDDIGNRSFEVRGKLSPKIASVLKSWVTQHRVLIEDAWLLVMIAKGWLTVQATGKTVVVTAYSGAATEIVKTLDFTSCPCWVEGDDVTIEGTTLILGSRLPQRAQVRRRLGRVIWTGADDGSDAGCIPF